jgi:4-hydroxy-3-polyprenylbenzoate decarboxylase
VDQQRDLHFHTHTTIDILDYSGTALHRGPKVVIAAVGSQKRTLPTAIPADLRLPDGFAEPRVVLPGVLAVRAPTHVTTSDGVASDLGAFCASLSPASALCAFPLVVLVDDSEFCARNLDNFLWVTFTRSNPALDIAGIGAATLHKHWGCFGSLVIDARQKSHHAPPLVEDPAVTARVDALFAQSGLLCGIET